MEENTVVLRFHHEEKEYVKAYRAYLLYSKILRKTDIIAFPVILVLLVGLSYLRGFDLLSAVIFTLFVIAAAIGSLLYFYIPVRGFRSNPKFQEEYTLAVSSEGMHFTTDSVDSLIKWDMYQYAWENAEHYYLIIERQQFSLIPKRVFESKEQQQLFVALVEAGIGPVKRVK